MSVSGRFAFDASVRSTDDDGRLHIAKSHISKATVNPYYGSEIPNHEALGLDPTKIYRLLRDPAELAAGAQTFARLPILSRHVPVNVDAPRQDLIIGAIGSEVEFNYPYLDADLCFWDATAIAGIETDTVRELSCAYRYVAVMVSGTFEGMDYDGRMTDIRGNHLALVEAGRAGSDVLAADEQLFTLDAAFIEGDHPRASNGEFGSGGGSKGEPISVNVSSKRHPFVNSFLKEHTTIAGQEKHLETVPTEKLHTALKLIDKSGDIEAGSVHVKKLIERELHSRSGTTADEAITTMKMTKLGKALYLTLGGLSPKLAQDSALPALVGKAAKKSINSEDISTKLVAMDAELDPKKTKSLIDSLIALDAEKEDKPKDKVAEDEDDEDDDEEMAGDEDDDEDDKKKKEMAKDAKLKVAMDSFKKELRDADEARRAVREVVGDVVAQDSAAGIYTFALDQMKVAHEGVTDANSLRALFNLANSSRTAAPVAVIAQDASGMAAMFPDANRFVQK